jgi:hypothetical protein
MSILDESFELNENGKRGRKKSRMKNDKVAKKKRNQTS